MITLTDIQNFLAPKKLAIAGVSRNPKKFGTVVFNELKEKGFEIYPINPNVDEIFGGKCYRSVTDLPEDVKYLYIVTPKDETVEVIKAAINKGIEKIWIQQSSDTPEAIKLAEENNIPLIYKKCIFMFVEPVESVHKFHRFIVRLFGAYPKEKIA